MNVSSIDKAVSFPITSVGLPVVKTDLTLESLLASFRKQSLYMFQLPFWLLRGKAAFKQEVARRVELNIRSLSWRTELSDLERERAQGRSLVFAGNRVAL